MPLLTVSGASKMQNGNFTVKAISFMQEPFQKIAIAGETGCGKTTLLKMIAGLEQPDAGEILFDNKRVLGPYEQLLPGHPRIAYLSQHFELRNNYFVHELLEMANRIPPKKADTIYSLCRIKHLLQRKTDQLSGGEKQRIALARLLTASPALLLLDEPFSNLDMQHKNIIKSVINDISEQMGITSIMVSHDATDILSWANTILIMKDGQVIQQDIPEQIYRQPVNEYCAGLSGEYNLISKELAGILYKAGGAHKEKKLIIRPEEFIVSGTVNSSITGTVQKILFWGSYYTIDVKVEQEIIRAKTSLHQFKEGDTVYVSLATGA